MADVTTRIVVGSGWPSIETGAATGEPVGAASLGATEISAVTDRVAAALDHLRDRSIVHGPINTITVRVHRDASRAILGVEFTLPSDGSGTLATPGTDVVAFAQFVGALTSGRDVAEIIAHAVADPGTYPNCWALTERVRNALQRSATPPSSGSPAGAPNPLAPNPLAPASAAQFPLRRAETTPSAPPQFPIRPPAPAPTPQPPQPTPAPSGQFPLQRPASAPETGPTPAPGMRFPLPQPDGGARQHNTPPEQPGTVSPPTVSAGPFPPAPPGQPFGTAPPPTPPKKRRRLLLGALAAAVVVVLVVGVGIWALLRDSSSSSSTTKLDAATGNSIWDQQIGSMVMCQADNPTLQSPAQTVKLDDFYAEALQLCFAQMWIPPMMRAGKALPPEGYTMHVAVSTSDVDASGPTSGCTQAFAAAQQYLNCPNGFWLRDPGGRYSSVPLAYAVDLSASMVAYQALITAGVVGEVATSMKDAGPTSEQAAAHSRTLNAASACLGGVMIKAAQGHGLSESDVAMLRNLATFGSVSTDGKPAFDISPGNYRYWRNYGIDNGTIESCKSPFDHQEQVK